MIINLKNHSEQDDTENIFFSNEYNVQLKFTDFF